MFFKKHKNILIFLLIYLLAGCATYYKKSADAEVYSILKEKDKKVGGMPEDFSIDKKFNLHFDDISTTPPIRLSLVNALELATKNSREYQSRKERLYLTALALTLTRHEWDPLYSATASGEIKREAKLNSLSGVLSLGVRKMLATGADLSVSLTTNMFRYLDVLDPQKSAQSVITATLTQPLLKGAGKKVAMENLTQEERDVIYAIREFVRFRKTFSVNIAKSYFRILKQKDQVNNVGNNYQSLKLERERAELMAQAGRLPEFQVDQTRQNELRARDQWIRATQTYKNLLDEFKLDLGLPADLNIELDPREMEKLTLKGIESLKISETEAIASALDRRLDLKNVREQVEDARRKIAVAKNALLPRLDAKFKYDNTTQQTQNPIKPLKFTDENDAYSGGLSLELPLDRKAARNNYRQALINYEVAKRKLTEQIDRTKLEVRNAIRNLEQAEQSYQIQKNSLSLAERRVESTSLLQQAGRASTRDVLDARDALLEAQNAVTSALVDHYYACLDLYLAMEAIKIDDNGIWHIEQVPQEVKDYAAGK
ncbi:MAG: TolC family protein [Candidatus Sumerlaeia bacterium]|nr:TolC family protein [Candidatus Sumerlaeia bacterium]